MDIRRFIHAVLEQDRVLLREFFHDTAYINWHCTNEHFNVEEYIKANCDYPGEWDGEIERIETHEDMIITAVRVFPKNKSASFHVVSFISIEGDKIRSMDEYWADDGEAPLWRQEMNIGKAIR